MSLTGQRLHIRRVDSDEWRRRATPMVPRESAVVLVVFFVGSTLAAFAVPGLVQLGYVPLAVIVALYLHRRGSPETVLEFSLWLMLATPFVRRVADFGTFYHPSSTVLVAGPLVALTGLLRVGKRALVLRWVVSVFAAVTAAYVYASATGILVNGVFAAGVQFVEWFGPVCMGLMVLFDATGRSAYIGSLRRFARLGALAGGTYGLVQFFVLPSWDAAWMRNVNTAANTFFGVPEPLQVRVFSLASSPSTFATLMSALILVLLAGRKHASDYAAVAVALAAVGLSEVRSAWIGLTIGVVALVIVRAVRVWAFIGGILAIGIVAVAVGGAATVAVTSRFDQTTSAGSGDSSLTARINFQAEQLPGALRDPVGRGLGSTGSAVTASNSSSVFANVDSGYLDALTVFGSVGGLCYLVLLLYASAAAWCQGLAARARGTEIGLLAALLIVPVITLFGTVTVEGAGVLVWAVLGISGSLGTERNPPGERSNADSQPALSLR